MPQDFHVYIAHSLIVDEEILDLFQYGRIQFIKLLDVAIEQTGIGTPRRLVSPTSARSGRPDHLGRQRG